MQFVVRNINLNLVKLLTLAWFHCDFVNDRYFVGGGDDGDRIDVNRCVLNRLYYDDSYSVCWILNYRAMIDWPVVGNTNPSPMCVVFSCRFFYKITTLFRLYVVVLTCVCYYSFAWFFCFYLTSSFFFIFDRFKFQMSQNSLLQLHKHKSEAFE